MIGGNERGWKANRPRIHPAQGGVACRTNQRGYPHGSRRGLNLSAPPGGFKLAAPFGAEDYKFHLAECQMKHFATRRQARSDRATQVANSNLAPGGNLGGVPVRNPITEPRPVRGGYTPTHVYPPPLFPPINHPKFSSSLTHWHYLPCKPTAIFFEKNAFFVVHFAFWVLNGV